MKTLTEKQRTILQYISKGLTDTEIADKLNTSVNALRYHISLALQHAHAENRAHLVAWGFRNKLLK